MTTPANETRGARYWVIRILLVAAGASGLILFTVSKPAFMLDPSYEIEVDGERRFYDVRLPMGYLADNAYPLLIVLHGGGGSASRVEHVLGLTERAGTRGYIVAYPEGLDNFWNDGRGGTHSRAVRDNVDDVAFLSSMVDTIAATHGVDQRRVFLLGVSNGAMMAMRFACEQGDRIAGVAAFNAGLPEPMSGACDKALGVPLFLVSGTGDEILPYEGGEVRIFGQHRGVMLGAEETVALWARGNGCVAPPLLAELPDIDPMDGVLTRTHQYTGCPGGEVLLHEMQGAGHTIPGLELPASERFLGPTTYDYDGVEFALDFFQRQMERTGS